MTWALVPVVTSTPSETLQQATGPLATSLEEAGQNVVHGPVLGHRMEASVSEPPPAEAPPELLARLEEMDRRLVERVAARQGNEALRLAEPLLTEAESQLPALNRDEATSRRLANICGYVVRAHAEARVRAAAEEAAQQAALRCFRMIPGFEPDSDQHPPRVVERIHQAREQLDGALAIQASGANGRSCLVRVNGVEIGSAPVARVRLPEGAYAVQVECAGEVGRVHHVEVEGETTLAVNLGLDEALQTGSTPALRYEDRLRSVSLRADLGELGRAVEAQRVLAMEENEGRLTLVTYAIFEAGEARELDRRTLDLPLRPEPLSDEIASVAQIPTPDPDTPVSASSSGGASFQTLFGVTSLIGGGVTLLISLVAGVVLITSNDRLIGMCPDHWCPESARDEASYVATLATAVDVMVATGSILSLTGPDPHPHRR